MKNIILQYTKLTQRMSMFFLVRVKDLQNNKIPTQ